MAATDHEAHDPGPARDLARPYWQVPALATGDRIIGGVAAGVAREVGVDPLWIRLGFVVLFSAGGWGGLLYLAAWGALAQLAYSGHGPSHPPVAKGRSRRARLTGIASVTLGLLVLFGNQPGLPSSLVWPTGVLGAGLLIAWRQVEPADVHRGRLRFAQIVGGSVVALAGVVLALATAFGLDSRGTGIWAGPGVAVGLVVMSAPWWWRMVQDLDAERQARIRSDERAEVAAHLHDSVLQTLTLIQKHGDDPQTMRNLARRQERELRNWLDPKRTDRAGHSVRGRLDELAGEIEQLHGVPVEVVTVGDCIVTEPIAAALAATREAAVNAARHSGTDRIDVYAEVGDTTVEFFVRDTGVGFERASVADDRRGISESIEGRMQRAGGTTTIITEPGAGTEVEIVVPRAGARSDEPPSEEPGAVS